VALALNRYQSLAIGNMLFTAGLGAQRCVYRYSRLVAQVIAFGFLLTIPGLCIAEESVALPEPYTRAFALRQKNECARAWDALWPLVAHGDRDATFVLVELLLSGMNPPGWNGRPPQPEGHQRRMLALFIFATQSHRNFGDELSYIRDTLPKGISELIIKYLPTLASARKVSTCFKTSLNNDECVNLAVSLDLIPPFEAFVKGFSSVRRRSGIAASCGPTQY
jgi:hypothetical protein